MTLRIANESYEQSGDGFMIDKGDKVTVPSLNN